MFLVRWHLSFTDNLKASWATIEKALREIECPNRKVAYNLAFKILNTKHFGLPQNRERVYIVGCRTSVALRPFKFPRGSPTPPLASCLDKQPCTDAHRPLSKTNMRNIKEAKAELREAGANPSAADVVVDIGSGTNRVNYMFDLCPTITKTRCASRDFYVLSKRRRLSMGEFARLQGFVPDDFNFAGIREREIGQMIGNSMSVPVLAAVLKEGLLVCGLAELSA